MKQINPDNENLDWKKELSHPNVICWECFTVFDYFDEYSRNGKCPQCFKKLPLCYTCKYVMVDLGVYLGNPEFNEPNEFYLCERCDGGCSCEWDDIRIKQDEKCTVHGNLMN